MYERIRNERTDRDLSQSDLAEMLRVHQTTYSDYELGNINIPIPVMVRLADLFGTSIDYLVERTDEKAPYPLRK